MAYDIILFDADGTLYDFDSSEAAAVTQTLTMAGLPTDDETVAQYHKINDAEWKALERGETTRSRLRVERFEKLKAALAASGHTSGMAADTIADYYVDRLSKQCILMPESYEVCERLSENCALYIITNGITSVQTSRFSKSSITKFIRRAYISEEMGVTKPAREYFDKVLYDIGLSETEARQRVLVVGDSLSSDIAGAVRAGLHCCWYNPSGESYGECKPDYIISDLRELYKICLAVNITDDM